MDNGERDEGSGEGIDRRGLLKCMTWGGTGLLWSLSAGLPSAMLVDQALGATTAKPFTFMQISDSHVGFMKPANPDARVTLREAIGKIRALAKKPDFIIHTGDISQLSRPEQFDEADQIIQSAGLPVFYVPGEHDMLDDENGKLYLSRYGKDTIGAGWFSFDHAGVHFVGLVNVANLKAGGMGSFGPDQLVWLKQDLAARSASTPIVIFAHIPLWTVSQDWGWGTDDAGEALTYLARFGSVTVLNGHIHQIMQKVEGRIAFHTADSTAFPQPAPGTAPSPGPMKVPDDRLRTLLGVTRVDVVRGDKPLAIIDAPLSA